MQVARGVAGKHAPVPAKRAEQASASGGASGNDGHQKGDKGKGKHKGHHRNADEYDDSMFQGPPRNLPRDEVFNLFGECFGISS